MTTIPAASGRELEQADREGTRDVVLADAEEDDAGDGHAER